MSAYEPYNPAPVYPNIPANQQYQSVDDSNVPQYQEHTPSQKSMESDGERFDYTASNFKDKWFAILFALHLLAIFVSAGVYGHFVKDQISSSSSSSSSDSSDSIPLEAVGCSIAAATAAGLLFGWLWLAVMKKYSDKIIKITLWGNAIIFGVASSCLFAKALSTPDKSSLYAGVVFAVIAMLQLVYYYCVRRRIPFTQAVISGSVSSVKDATGTLYMSVSMALLQLVWFGSWAFTVAAIKYSLHMKEGENFTGAHGGIFFGLLVSFFWTQQVIKNVSHVTTSGAVASWWLVPSVASPTCPALKRACTTSFGSICFGSLIVAVLEAVRVMVKQARETAKRSKNEGAECALCCLDCILRSVERMVQFFNVYAYTHVAIYGKDFISSAKDTWKMFKERGFDVLINDDLTSMVLNMGCLLGAVFAGIAGFAVGLVVSTHGDVRIALACIGALVGLLTVALMMTVVHSAVATTFVVWAEMPNELASTRPEHYQKLVDAARILHPERADF